MRKLFISAVALAGLSGAAFAADLPSRKEAPVYAPTPAFSWEGFYVGGDLGGAWTTDSLSETSAFPALIPNIGYASMGSAGSPAASTSAIIGKRAPLFMASRRISS